MAKTTEEIPTEAQQALVAIKQFVEAAKASSATAAESQALVAASRDAQCAIRKNTAATSAWDSAAVAEDAFAASTNCFRLRALAAPPSGFPQWFWP